MSDLFNPTRAPMIQDSAKLRISGIWDETMNLRKKLNVNVGMKLNVVAKPTSVDLGDIVTTRASDNGALIFVKTLNDVEALCGPAIEAALADRLAWVAYPKAGQLGTDLDREILRKRLLRYRIRGVRQVAIDAVWSAMRFRPAGWSVRAVPRPD